jgi:hypothetical protein
MFGVSNVLKDFSKMKNYEMILEDENNVVVII